MLRIMLYATSRGVKLTRIVTMLDSSGSGNTAVKKFYNIDHNIGHK